MHQQVHKAIKCNYLQSVNGMRTLGECASCHYLVLINEILFILIWYNYRNHNAKGFQLALNTKLMIEWSLVVQEWKIPKYFVVRAHSHSAINMIIKWQQLKRVQGNSTHAATSFFRQDLHAFALHHDPTFPSSASKVLPGFENLLFGHSSWFTYAATMRIYKHWDLRVSDTHTATGKMSFSSYPGTSRQITHMSCIYSPNISSVHLEDVRFVACWGNCVF